MEGSLLVLFLACMGGLSLYVVIATIVGRSVYSRTRGWTEDGRYAAAIFCGFLFPISVPVLIIVVWFWSIIRFPMGDDDEDQTTNIGDSRELNAVEERVRNLEDRRQSDESMVSEQTPSKPKTKFKVGDLITGVRGNPASYKHLYEGCVCRVLNTNEDKAMNVVLVDHIDLNAHREEIGQRFKAPPKYFTLVKQKTKAKKVAKKKKK